MGLLDEAIREHLELKRRRGADPAEVAREQHEALDPLTDRAGTAELDASTEEHALEHDTGLAEGELSAIPAHESVADAPGHPPHESLPDAGPLEQQTLLEETAELDMNTVLDEDSAEDAHLEQPAQQPERAWIEAHEPLASGQEHVGSEPGTPPD